MHHEVSKNTTEVWNGTLSGKKDPTVSVKSVPPEDETTSIRGSVANCVRIQFAELSGKLWIVKTVVVQPRLPEITAALPLRSIVGAKSSILLAPSLHLATVSLLTFMTARKNTSEARSVSPLRFVQARNSLEIVVETAPTTREATLSDNVLRAPCDFQFYMNECSSLVPRGPSSRNRGIRSVGQRILSVLCVER